MAAIKITNGLFEFSLGNMKHLLNGLRRCPVRERQKTSVILKFGKD
jgi:hypothetical protein